jgi:hypothetical protein
MRKTVKVSDAQLLGFYHLAMEQIREKIPKAAMTETRLYLELPDAEVIKVTNCYIEFY